MHRVLLLLQGTTSLLSGSFGEVGGLGSQVRQSGSHDVELGTGGSNTIAPLEAHHA